MKKPSTKTNPSGGGDNLLKLSNEHCPFGAPDFSRLEIPYRDYPHTSGGNTIRQIFDRASALAFCKALANGVQSGKSKGVPIYHGHPDVPELAVKYPDKRAHGWIPRAEALDDRLAMFPAWNEEPGNHFSHISPYWFVRAATGRVEAIQSIALVNHPMIPELRLPNEDPEGPTDNPGPAKEPPMNPKTLELLGLANDADAVAVHTAVQALHAQHADEKAKAGDGATKLAAALAERDAALAALANERAARVTDRLDAAVTDGRITQAGRAAWQERLDTDFDAGLKALANEKPQVKTAPAANGAKKPAVPHQDVIALANERMAQQKIGFREAYSQIKAENPDLFA